LKCVQASTSFFTLCQLPIFLILFFKIVDAIGSKPKSYFVFKSDKNPYGILEETLFLFLSSILYISIILLSDYKIFHLLYQYAFNKIIGTGESYRDVNEDPDVSKERDKVNAAKTHPSTLLKTSVNK